MKACILSGGEGRRLRPLTSLLPKPMLPVLGVPALTHMLRYLKGMGIREMLMTLMYMPEVIKREYGDGAQFGADIRYFTEKSPLGTAGGIKSCEDYFEDGDFLVISGDALTDLDLKKAMDFHREKEAVITVVLTRNDNPLEYGLVHADESGRVLRFAEKPVWGQVFTNLVNTGIYIISPKALNYIPKDSAFDFARDLFPLLLEQNLPVYACELSGYWCDIGDSASYLKAQTDALTGKISLEHGLWEYSPGVFIGENASLPEGVIINPPVFIHPAATVLPGATLGPGAVLTRGAYVGESCHISDSLIDGSLGSNCEAEGSIVCPGASAGNSVFLGRGSVLGSGSGVGDGSFVGRNVRIWPGISVEPGSSVKSSLTSGGYRRAVFDDNMLSGAFPSGLSPELCMELGGAVTTLAEGNRRVAVGSAGGADAALLAAAVACGLCAGGCDVVSHDISFAAGAGAMTAIAGTAVSVFVESGDEPSVHIFGAGGKYISRQDQKKLEGLIFRGEIPRVPAIAAGRVSVFSGAPEAYCAAMVQAAMPKGSVRAAVYGRHPAAAALARAMAMTGCRVPEEPSLSFDGLLVSVSRDGRSFTLKDRHAKYDEQETFGLVLLCAMLMQPGITVALPYDAPGAFDIMASENGGNIIRLGRDGEKADRLYARQPYTHDAVCGALMLLSFLAESGTTPASLRSMLPAYGSSFAEVDCRSERSELMRRIGESCADMTREYVDGLKICLDGGYVRISPSASKASLKIYAESFSEETAREIAADFSDRARRLDDPGR